MGAGAPWMVLSLHNPGWIESCNRAMETSLEREKERERELENAVYSPLELQKDR